jgi:hypothetical protein
VRIEARLNSVHVKETCMACGAWGRAGDVAYFDGENSWVCDRCAEGGIEHIRSKLRESAAYYRRLARQYDEAADEHITIVHDLSDEDQRHLAEIEAEMAKCQARERREQIRLQNSPNYKEFLDGLPF